MDRLIYNELLLWKKSERRKPLILRGARQVGKTYSIKDFGHKNFKNVVFVDLEKNRDWHRLFENNIDIKNICSELEILVNQKILPNETLLVFDEIQTCPRAIMSLRYFYEDYPELHVVAAGSLLEFALKDISFPVGRVQFLTMHPMTFVEYLFATGKKNVAHELLKLPTVLSDTLHKTIIEELRRYFFIGGMPESVNTWVKTGSIKDCFDVQQEICETYRMDFSKYSQQVDKNCINSVLTSIAQLVGQQIKYSKLAEDYNTNTIKKALESLCLAGIVQKIPTASPAGLPFGATASAKIFKAILVDIGLMRCLCKMSADVEYPTPDLLNIYRGAMAEQFVGQEMAVAQNGELFYWARTEKSSNAEVDYIFSKEEKIYAVEVKSGAKGSLKSLNLLLNTFVNCNGMVFSVREFSKALDDKISFVPIYNAYSATGGKGKFVE